MVAEGVVTDISHEGLRQLLHEEDVRFQAVRTWKRSTDPDFERKRDRILALYALAEQGKAVVICLDELARSPPAPARWQGLGSPGEAATRPRYLPASARRAPPALRLRRLPRSPLRPHQRRKARSEFLEFCRYVRSLYPAEVRLHFVLDNFSAHEGEQVRDWAAENNVELAYTPFYASWLNRIEAQFKALRYFTLNGTDHPDHATRRD